LDYWAKVSDGVPKEICGINGVGGSNFLKSDSTTHLCWISLTSSGAGGDVAAHRLSGDFFGGDNRLEISGFAQIYAMECRPRPDVSMYGWLSRHQPGIRAHSPAADAVARR
jgi:hypothetical protein